MSKLIELLEHLDYQCLQGNTDIEIKDKIFLSSIKYLYKFKGGIEKLNILESFFTSITPFSISPYGIRVFNTKAFNLVILILFTPTYLIKS